MSNKEILKKAESNEGLSVEEIKVYQDSVKPVKHVYGKYGNLAKLISKNITSVSCGHWQGIYPNIYTV